MLCWILDFENETYSLKKIWIHYDKDIAIPVIIIIIIMFSGGNRGTRVLIGSY